MTAPYVGGCAPCRYDADHRAAHLAEVATPVQLTLTTGQLLYLAALVDIDEGENNDAAYGVDGAELRAALLPDADTVEAAKLDSTGRTDGPMTWADVHRELNSRKA